MEHQPTPSPSSLASLLNPVHSPPPTHQQHSLQQQQQQQQQQKQQQYPPQLHPLHPLKKVISDRNHHPTKRTKTTSSSTLLFIDPKPMSTLVENQLKLTTTEQQPIINKPFKQTHNNNNHPPHSRPETNQNISSATSTASSAASGSVTIESNLEESIFGIAPFNDFTWTIAQFIWQHSREYWERGEGGLIEVEAKLGTIRDRRSQSSERMEYPIATESPILDTSQTKFQTDMPPKHHATLNRLLNQRVTETCSAGYLGAKVDYLHLKEVDEFHDGKVRVSRDWSGKNPQSPPRSIVKEKLAHLDIHCPGRSFDFRISVNVEHPVPMPPEHSNPSYKRIKDRLSYSHQICQIDLTQVKSTDQQKGSTSTHEVEVEFKDSCELLRAASVWAREQEEGPETGARRASNGDQQHPGSDEDGDQRPPGSQKLLSRDQDRLDAQQYLLMVEVLLNNVRMLIRNC
ncbi:mRNA-capping enzyme subunit beta [Puccinia graminis f. sp. tritici]|uniref:mRNA-capping enzyme subunit beta n=1 Tax=Puccinia graminis f. sp. tritici TaxID=56615 RepID=A0A5B0PBD2_PUCGR|nr:mRNA-capping enzyme subunit beta [Puccinia graminis f. sp. tritici]KAA1116929.1 mRNA-capping enzyme subunit beta [Puccinia graminis f. sp. tritici]